MNLPGPVRKALQANPLRGQVGGSCARKSRLFWAHEQGRHFVFVRGSITACKLFATLKPFLFRTELGEPGHLD